MSPRCSTELLTQPLERYVCVPGQLEQRPAIRGVASPGPLRDFDAELHTGVGLALG
jgi:hypothetical protein